MDEVERGLSVLILFRCGHSIVMRLRDRHDPPEWVRFLGVIYPDGRRGKSVNKKATVFLEESTAKELLPVYHER